jgi:hypothetical protein
VLAVQGQRGQGVGRAEVVGEGERQAEQPGQLGAVAAGAEQPHGGQVALAGHRGEPGVRVVLRPAAGEEAEQVHQLVGEVVGGQRLRRAAQRGRRDLVGAGRAADAEVDPAGVERLQHAELLGDHQRHVVGQHDAAGADPQGGGRVGDVADQHRRRGARDAGHVVVLGHPEPVVPEAFGVLGQVGRGAQRAGGGPAVGHRGQVEHGQGHGASAEGQGRIIHACPNSAGRRILPAARAGGGGRGGYRLRSALRSLTR